MVTKQYVTRLSTRKRASKFISSEVMDIRSIADEIMVSWAFNGKVKWSSEVVLEVSTDFNPPVIATGNVKYDRFGKFKS